MTVRLATSDDIDGVAAIYGQLRTKGFDSQTFLESYQAILASPDRALLVIDGDDGIVGMAVVNIIEKLADREARVDEVLVSGRSRGKGYGQKLMQACDAWAFENGASSVEFTSRPSREAANALYQKLGYTLRQTNVYQRKRD